MTKSPTYAVLYTWPPGTECAGKVEVRYRRSREHTELARQVLSLQRHARAGQWESPCPYSISTRPEHTL